MSTKTIGEQIADLEATRASKATEMETVVQKSVDEGRSMATDEAEQFDTLEGEVKSLEADLDRLRKLEAIQAKSAKPANVIAKENGSQKMEPDTTKIGVTVKNTQKLEPGIEFARYAMCKLAAGKNNPQMAVHLAKTHYPDNERIVKALEFQAAGRSLQGVMKAAVEAGTTLDPTWAAPLVDYQNFAGDFVEFLRPQTIIGQFGAGNVPGLNLIPFNVRIAGQTSGGSAYWVGEGAPKPLTRADFTATELRWAKVAAISVLTNELIRFSSPSAERLVRDTLAAAVIERIDQDFIDPAKALVPNVSPASITNGAVAIPATGTDADGIRCDLQALWAPFIAARNPPRTAVYIMDSTTALALSLMRNPIGQAEFPGLGMNGGLLNGVPVIVSDYVPSDSGGSTVVLVNARDVWLADDGQVTIDASGEASLQMDDEPTNDSSVPTATTLVSMFQTDSTAFRAERFINWARRRDSGVAYLTGVNWSSCTP
jgi:HK97 family phage major capsid protein